MTVDAVRGDALTRFGLETLAVEGDLDAIRLDEMSSPIAAISANGAR